MVLNSHTHINDILGQSWKTRTLLVVPKLIIIIIIFYFNWVAISQRLQLRPPVSHTLAHTQNQIKSNSNCLMAVVGHLLSCSQVGGRGVKGKNSKWHTGGGVPFTQCLIDFSANLLSHQHPPPPPPPRCPRYAGSTVISDEIIK